MSNQFPFRPLHFLLVVSLCLCQNAAALLKGNITNDGKFRVFRIVPQLPDELALLGSLFKSAHDYELDFWKAPTRIGVFTDVMVAPAFASSFASLLKQQHLQHETIIDDVEGLIIRREKKERSADADTVDEFKRMRDAQGVARNLARYGFGDYHSYEEIVRWMVDIERFYPQIARTFTIGTTNEGRPIRGIKIGNPVGDSAKRAVWVDAGIHAREWASIHTALWFIDQLISLYRVDPQITAYVDSLNLYFLPSANPDGFEYSRQNSLPQTRFWRKNRGTERCRMDGWGRQRCCSGVDLNRNFDFHWGETGSSSDVCSEIYQGAFAFSEPESRAIRDKILSPELFGKLDAFITLHTYSQMWIHPFSHVRNVYPFDVAELQNIGRRGVRAIESMYGTKYRFGTSADILYPSSGGSDDWAKDKANVKYVYLLELRPGEEKWDGFLLDRQQLIPTGRETWEGIKVVLDAVLQRSRDLQPWRGLPPPPIAPRVIAPNVPPQPWQQPTRNAVAPPSLPRQLPQQLPRPPMMSRRTNSNSMASTIFVAPYHAFRMNLAHLSRTGSSTLGRAVSPTNCIDRQPWCAEWVRDYPQICANSRNMQRDCTRTCRLCTNVKMK